MWEFPQGREFQVAVTMNKSPHLNMIDSIDSTNIALENGASQKEIILPTITIDFQGLRSFRGGQLK